MKTARLGIGSLMGTASFARVLFLPSGVTFCCPICGETALNGGECYVELKKTKGQSKTGSVAELCVECKKCGYFGQKAGIK
ncbi:MAG: hypothetical protein V1892_03480 [bacterium]